MQRLNFVLLPWRKNFRAQLHQITHVDQWIKISFLPTEYWSWRYLTQIVSGVGNPIRLHRYTNENVEKGLFARVCVNLNISKPVHRSIAFNFGHDIQIFHISYEGVWEVCPICGDASHTMNLCPQKPVPCLELVVAKMDVASLTAPTASEYFSYC